MDSNTKSSGKGVFLGVVIIIVVIGIVYLIVHEHPNISPPIYTMLGALGLKAHQPNPPSLIFTQPPKPDNFLVLTQPNYYNSKPPNYPPPLIPPKPPNYPPPLTPPKPPNYPPPPPIYTPPPQYNPPPQIGDGSYGGGASKPPDQIFYTPPSFDLVMI